MIEISRMVVIGFLGPGDEETWYRTSNDKPKETWNVSHTR